MKIIRRINVGKYTHAGISKRGKVHVGYWDDDLDGMRRVPRDPIINDSKRVSKH